MTVAITPSTISHWGRELQSESTPLARRYRALFALKHHACLEPPTENTQPAIEAMAGAFSTPSALLKHEVAYCLGQTKNRSTAKYLRAVLENRDEDPMCRHEAAEAIGALGDTDSLALLKARRDDEAEKTVVRETCEIAVERIEWENGVDRNGEKIRKRLEFIHKRGSMRDDANVCSSDFSSIDPAPPMPEEDSRPNIPELQRTLTDESIPLFKRYRAMFALRDLASPPDLPTAVPAVHALATGFSDSSALFRHEIAFVFGQLSHPASIPSLSEALSNLSEDAMVRHEAAEALGGLGEEEGVEEFLKKFLHDKEKVVAESVQVALDMAEFEKSGELNYASVPGEETAPVVVASA